MLTAIACNRERLAANALSDLYAMGAEPQTALAIAVLPVWPAEKTADELRQMLRGAQVAFDESGTALVGGHTSEGVELSLSFSVTGLIDRDRVPSLIFWALRAAERRVSRTSSRGRRARSSCRSAL